MKTKPPPLRRKFADAWDEIEYLYQKILYWLYDRADAKKASRFAERLQRRLQNVDRAHESIFGEECRSLACEARGDLANAIEHRENEIRRIQQLHKMSQRTPHEAFALKQYGHDDLSDRFDLLAVLYHDHGQLDKAVNILQDSKRYCEKHGIAFDGEDILREYLEEKENAGCHAFSAPAKQANRAV